MQRRSWQIILILVVAFIARSILSLTTYNNDINNHMAWMDSVKQSGWQGIYERDVSPYASVNYPPLTLYSFYVGETLYQTIPLEWQSPQLHASLYKIPSLLADSLIAYLIWRLTPFRPKVRLALMAISLFNPALILNSVFWGQVESLSALTAIATIFALIHKRADLALVAFTLGLLVKQNILPLAPLVLLGIILSRPTLTHLFSSLAVSVSLVFLTYAPLVPARLSAIPYIVSTYLSSIGGQVHQHLGSVNALNLWYLLAFNHQPDTSIRLIGIALTISGLIAGLYWYKRLYGKPYLSYWTAAAIISLTTFAFATRMHERHSYMAVAYLVFLLPYRKWQGIYLAVSVISFYNVLSVWLEYFASPPSLPWVVVTLVLSLVMVIVAICSLFTPQLLHQNRIESEIMDRGEA